MIFAGHIDPFGPEIILKNSKNTQWIVLINVVGLELVQNDQNKQLHEDLLTEKNVYKPKQQIIPLSALCSILANDISVID
jgi:hypothetical protein